MCPTKFRRQKQTPFTIVPSKIFEPSDVAFTNFSDRNDNDRQVDQMSKIYLIMFIVCFCIICHGHEFQFRFPITLVQCGLLQKWIMPLKVSKSRNQFMVFKILPKKQTKFTILSKEDAQYSEFCSFFGRIEDTIN